MSDAVWTALIAGGTGVLSGGVGWLTARGQHAIESRKLARDEGQGTALERKFRQGLYLRYITAIDTLMLSIGEGEPPITPEALESVWLPARSLDDEMELFAHDCVIPAREEIWELADVFRRRRRSHKPEPLEEVPQVSEEWKRYLRARRCLIASMRDDVGPSAGSHSGHGRLRRVRAPNPPPRSGRM